MSQFKLALLVLLASSYIAFGQMDIYYSASQPGYTDLSFSPTSGFAQPDEGLTPASGHYLQRNMQVTQTDSNEVKAKIPNLVQDSGQMRSDGTFSSYANVGSSAGANAQAFLGFDISSIPKEANIRSATLEFEGWNMIGNPFSKLGCLNIMPTSYSLIGSQSYSNIASTSPFVKICSSGQLNLPITTQDLTNALQASLGRGLFQLRLQFDRGTSGLESGSTTINRVYSIGGDSASSDDYLSSGIIRKYTSGVDSANNYLSSGTSIDRQTLQDMGFDQAFLQSDFSENGASRISKYIVLTPDFNLSKLGITQDMLEEAIDPGRVRVSRLEEGAPCISEGKSGVWHSDGSFWICDTGESSEACPRIADYSQIDMTYCDDCDNNNICDYKNSTSPEPPQTVVNPGGIDCGSGMVKTCTNIGNADEPGGQRQVCICEPIQNPKQNPGEKLEQVSQDLIKIGIVWLTVAYSLPQLVPPQPTCYQLSCQAQSKATGAPFSKDGRMYQAFSDCNCVGGECQCKSVERDTGPAPCDQQSCQARNRAIGSAYSRDGKIYQEVYECNCVENACRCAKVEKLIGNEQKPPLLPLPMLVLPRGNVTFKKPDAGSIIETSQWGEVPVNQVLVELRNGTQIADLERLVDSLNGQIVGYDESINLYQIETSSKTEAELIEAISKAKSNLDVTLAFPNQEMYFFQSTLNDPVYGGNLRRSYDIIGVEEAWNFIRDSNLTLNEVRVGVTDDGLFRGFGEFNDTIHIVTDEESELKSPLKGREHCPEAGSHGTGVMNIIAADPEDGGLVGIASKALGSNLIVFMYNYTSPEYYKIVEGGPYTQALFTLDAALGREAKIFSISWGIREADPDLVKNYKHKVSDWAIWNPSILLVCAIPNAINPRDQRENRSMDVSRCIAGGLNLSNVITVGSIMNNGSILSSCWGSQNYQVNLAAPGEEVIYYKDDINAYKNARHFGGTSMAVPMVTSAAAMIRSLNKSLTAAEIKAILIGTARSSINVSGEEVPVPEKLSGRVLAIDLAVKKVIEDRKNDTLRQ